MAAAGFTGIKLVTSMIQRNQHAHINLLVVHKTQRFDARQINQAGNGWWSKIVAVANITTITYHFCTHNEVSSADWTDMAYQTSADLLAKHNTT